MTQWRLTVNVGDKQYKTALAQWSALYRVKLANQLTFRQAVQLDALDKQLSAAEARYGIAPATEDYPEAVRLVGDLGGAEL